MDFRLLGPLEVAERDRPLALGGRKQRALLAVLLLNANDVVSTERLVDELWGASPPATVAKSIQVYVSRLRKELGDGRLITRTPGYVLRVEDSELDVARFGRLVEEAAGADPGTAAEKLREALALWRGPPFADLAYEPFLQAEIARLEELRLAALEQRIDAELGAGRHAQLAGEIEALITQHPLRERLRGQHMLCLYRSGRQAEALESYQAARAALVEELGIEPGRRLRALQQAILEQDPALEPAAAAAEPAPEPEGALPSGAFVGRVHELAELLGGLDDAFARRGRLFLVSGEPGIGKSRLAEELTARARARGARVLIGRCWEGGGAPAYWPWVQSLRAHVRDADAAALLEQLGPGAADLAQILPELRRRFPDLPQPVAPESEGARFRLFDSTAEFLRNAAASRPIVLVLDDLHAADASSLLLLRFLARELGSARVLVLGAFRDVEPVPGRALTEMLADVAREPVTRRLALAGLSEEEVAEYVELTAADVASPELFAGLQEETEGNPLFVGEFVRLLSVEGVRSIPQSVRDVIARRLTHLSEECNRVLALASVIGREFGLDVLGRLAGVTVDELLDTLDEAMTARVVADVPGAGGRLRFAHVLIRDTLYDALTAARRLRLHRLAVEALEALRGEHLAELAHHAIAGGDVDKGLAYARRAGDRALGQLAYEEAARQFAIALDLAQDERARCELLLSLAEAESRAGNTAESKRAFLDAAAIARRLGLAPELAYAAAEYGGRVVYDRGSSDPKLLPLLEEALAALGEEDVRLRVRLLARISGALRDEPSRDRRDALSAEAVALARRLEDPAALAYALDGRAIAIVAPDTAEECVAIGAELRELGERTGDMERVVHGYMHRFGALIMLGRLEEAKADHEAARRIADELRQPAQVFDVLGGDAMLAVGEGRLAEAEPLVEQALAVGEPVQPEMAIPVHHVQWCTLCDFRGTLEEVEPAIVELAAEYGVRPVLRCVLAYVQARLGRSEAKATLDALTRDDCAVLPFDVEWLFAMSTLAETAGLLGDADTAEVLYPLLAPWAAFNAVDQCEGIRGSVSRYLGILAATMRRWGDAERHFEGAIAMNAAWGMRPWLARTRDDYARMLLARGEPGDDERAQALAARALAGYRELGIAVTSAGTTPR